MVQASAMDACATTKRPHRPRAPCRRWPPEASSRLRRANERVGEFGDKASADMMSLDAMRHLWKARVDPRRRTFAAGIYTHVRHHWGSVYGQPTVLNERQQGVAIEGVEQHTELKIASACRCLPSIPMATRTRRWRWPSCWDSTSAERKQYQPRVMSVPEELEPVSLWRVSFAAIDRGWVDLLRLAASIRSGRVAAALAMQRFGAAAQGDPLHRAAEHLRRLLRSILTSVVKSTRCSTAASPYIRLQRAIYSGRLAPERGRRRDELRTISGSHALLRAVFVSPSKIPQSLASRELPQWLRSCLRSRSRAFNSRMR